MVTLINEAVKPKSIFIELGGRLEDVPGNNWAFDRLLDIRSVGEIIFTVSNDGGKTGIYWRDNAKECLDYLEPHKDTMSDYCVVAVRKTAK